eukprot:TRINITY_DN9318_c0_g4_i1.p2 TRINITY_DN9318_c0_g4~~TRINITY_DN9318_c0_g4_i1.p2  ORF type:complete len:168 (-),score=48.32 TRINITY_DN9318_c0_g4_i1:52-555(-)
MGGDIWYTDNYTTYGSYLMINPGETTPLMTEGFYLGNTLFDIRKKKGKSIYILTSQGEEGQTRTEIDADNTGEFFVGRDLLDKVQVMEDETVSSHHAQLTFDSSTSTWNIKDHGRKGTGSSNGTWIKIGKDTIIMGAEQLMRIDKDCFIIFKHALSLIHICRCRRAI